MVKELDLNLLVPDWVISSQLSSAVSARRFESCACRYIFSAFSFGCHGNFRIHGVGRGGKRLPAMHVLGDVYEPDGNNINW